jgi:hypothetical protein
MVINILLTHIGNVRNSAENPASPDLDFEKKIRYLKPKCTMLHTQIHTPDDCAFHT